MNRFYVNRWSTEYLIDLSSWSKASLSVDSSSQSYTGRFAVRSFGREECIIGGYLKVYKDKMIFPLWCAPAPWPAMSGETQERQRINMLNKWLTGIGAQLEVRSADSHWEQSSAAPFVPTKPSCLSSTITPGPTDGRGREDDIVGNPLAVLLKEMVVLGIEGGDRCLQ